MENITTTNPEVSLQQLFADGNYKEFITQVMRRQEEYSPAQYHMLLGSAYAKSEELALGRYHLEKAKHLGHHSTELDNNLAAVKQRLQVNDLTTSRSIADQVTYQTHRLPSEIYWSFSLLLLCAALFILWRTQLRRWGLAVVLLLVSFAPLTFERSVVAETHFAVTLEKGEILEGPSKIFPGKVGFPAGAMVVIGKSMDNWVFIEAPLIYSGWVDRSLLGFY